MKFLAKVIISVLIMGGTFAYLLDYAFNHDPMTKLQTTYTIIIMLVAFGMSMLIIEPKIFTSRAYALMVCLASHRSVSEAMEKSIYTTKKYRREYLFHLTGCRTYRELYKYALSTKR